MNEQIHTNRLPDQRQMIVVLEFNDEIGLDMAQEIFELFKGHELKCTAQTVSFGAMYAIELADVLVKLSEKYDMYFELIQTGLTLKIVMELQ